MKSFGKFCSQFRLKVSIQHIMSFRLHLILVSTLVIWLTISNVECRPELRKMVRFGYRSVKGFVKSLPLAELSNAPPQQVIINSDLPVNFEDFEEDDDPANEPVINDTTLPKTIDPPAAPDSPPETPPEIAAVEAPAPVSGDPVVADEIAPPSSASDVVPNAPSDTPAEVEPQAAPAEPPAAAAEPAEVSTDPPAEEQALSS